MQFVTGIGPNQLLAKIAGKLEKPDGLQWLAPENMPKAISHLQLDDLPGISRGIKQKLHKAMIWDVQALYALDPRHARQIWHSVEGERFVRALQGENCQRRSKNRPFGGVKVGHCATGCFETGDGRAFSGGTDRRAGLPACRSGSPEKVFIFLREGLRPI